ncbi:MAG: PilZ domain-containing protein [Acidiferrobacterales bacterium]
MDANPMSANRRISPRRELGVTAMIAHKGGGLTKCRLRDLSVEGAFVETGALQLFANTEVDLVIKTRSGKKRKHCRIPATVLRVIQDGAALIFGDLDEDVYRTLVSIVYPDED